jgi:carbon monoxide dehydrogenase subunit G
VKVSGAYRLAMPRERAYALLQDPLILARCMPGCESLEKIGEDEYAMRMTMALAAVSGKFDGKVRITEAQPPVQFRLTVEGAGKIGFMKGGGLLTLSEADGATDVRYEGEVNVGGTIAAVGQRLIDTTAKMMIKRFFDKLAGEAGKVVGLG